MIAEHEYHVVEERTAWWLRWWRARLYVVRCHGCTYCSGPFTTHDTAAAFADLLQSV